MTLTAFSMETNRHSLIVLAWIIVGVAGRPGVVNFWQRWQGYRTVDFSASISQPCSSLQLEAGATHRRNIKSGFK
jgi:hypothetical protein